MIEYIKSFRYDETKMIPTPAGQSESKMSGDVRISGQFGAVGATNHQLGGITHMNQQQNR